MRWNILKLSRLKYTFTVSCLTSCNKIDSMLKLASLGGVIA
jgi:hypothetical protein